jgi:hypothetical protein
LQHKILPASIANDNHSRLQCKKQSKGHYL